MIWKASILLSLGLCVLCLPRDRRLAVAELKLEHHIGDHRGDLSHIGHQKPEHHDGYARTYPSYEFSYKVDDPHTHDKKAQHEERNGGDVTGNYWLIQPDGKKRYIRYHVDDESGFTAVINYTSPHSSVYYNVMKHRDHAGNKEADKQEEKGKEAQQDARQEGEDKKREGLKNEENNGKLGDNTKNNDDKQNKKSVENEQQDHRTENYRDDKDLQDDRRESDNIGDRDDKQQSGRSDVKKDDQEGNNNKQVLPDIRYGDRNEDRDNNRDGSLDNNHSGDRNRDGKDELPKKKQVEQQRSGKEIQKNGKYEDYDLWAGLKGWTLIHDRPKNNEKPVWEWDIDQDRPWPGSHSWNDYLQVNENKREGSEEMRGGDDEERASGEEKRSGSEERLRYVEDRDGKDKQSWGEERQRYINGRGELGAEKRDYGEQNKKSDEDKQNRDDYRRERIGGRLEESEDRQRGGDIRRGDGENQWRDD